MLHSLSKAEIFKICVNLWANLQENVYSTYKIFFGYKRFIRKNLLFL